MNQDYDYIRNYYQVPARRGAPVKYKGRVGKVTGSHGAHVQIKLEGDAKSTGPYHPTWKIEWLEQRKDQP